MHLILSSRQLSNNLHIYREMRKVHLQNTGQSVTAYGSPNHIPVCVRVCMSMIAEGSSLWVTGVVPLPYCSLPSF